jgi:hypothetical protein
MSRALAAVIACGLTATVAGAQIQVVSTSPALNAVAAATAVVSVEFDRAVDPTTVDFDTFRVFGAGSGAARGTIMLSNGNKTVTLTPDAPFSAGEFVFVNLSHDIRGADTTALRAAGWAWQFTIAVAASPGVFQQIASFSNRSGAGNTRIYGASSSDLNDDGYRDLATINEDSGDVRVFLNRADGSGLYHPMLPRQAIGIEASPNEPADFDNDGRVDLCVAAASTEDVWVLLGDGDGTYSPVTGIEVGGQPHGIVALDVDGDADPDIVTARVGANELTLLVNDGAGNFGAPIEFEGGVDGEYGLVAADMNADGITDLVVGGRNGADVNTMLGNGNGTFTAAGPPQNSGGSTWVIVLGDVNGDMLLDVAAANDGSGNIGVLMGNGDGTFDPPAILPIGSHVPSVDLGDLDGDGDLDMVVSSFGGGFWRRFSNDGTGSFTLEEEYDADANPSCSILLDIDNDGDLDMALTDEIADTIRIMENTADTESPCSPVPLGCRQPIAAEKAKLTIKDKAAPKPDSLVWKWMKGSITPKADFGNPVSGTNYALCLYKNGALVEGWRAPAGQMCGNKPCWKNATHAFSYRDPERTPDGILSVKLNEGLIPGKANVTVIANNANFSPPDLSQFDGDDVLDVQLQQVPGSVCFGATYTAPFRRLNAETLIAVSDAPIVTTTTSTTTTTTLPALWSAIHAEVIGPTCGGCHGGAGSGGLAGLNDCDTAHANLVGVASTELPTMNRVEPNTPSNSWLMHKLDGTQDWFTAMCSGGFCGSQMPLGGDPLSTEVRDAIRDWIEDGALNDCP